MTDIDLRDDVVDLREPVDGTTFGIEDEKRAYRIEDLQECELGYEIAKEHGVESEFKRSMFEIATDVLTISQVPGAIDRLCDQGLELALRHGCLPLDSSMPLNPPSGGLACSPERRYLLQDSLIRGLGDSSATGVHVHVNVQNPDKRVQVRDRLSSYEHLLIALTGGSPFENRFHSRMASVRTERFGAFHTAFDPLWTGSSEAHKEHLRVQLRATGLYDLDPEPHVFRYTHPRTRVSMDGKPTVELRTMENPLTRQDFVWAVYLAIGLTNRVIDDIDNGLPPAASRDVHIEHRAMRKRALTFGMSDLLHHPSTMELKPAWDVAGEWFEYIEPGLWRADPTGSAAETFRALSELVRVRGAAAQRLVDLHDAVHRARSEEGSPVANYERWVNGREPMTVDTARDLTAAVILYHQFGSLEHANIQDVLKTVDPSDAREILDNHGAALQRLQFEYGHGVVS